MLSCDGRRYIETFDWLGNFSREASGRYKLYSYWLMEMIAVPGIPQLSRNTDKTISAN